MRERGGRERERERERKREKEREREIKIISKNLSGEVCHFAKPLHHLFKKDNCFRFQKETHFKQ